jgi:hypothetical protein
MPMTLPTHCTVRRVESSLLRPKSKSRELREQHSGLRESRGLEALAESIVHSGEHLARFSLAAAPGKEPAETGGRSAAI